MFIQLFTNAFYAVQQRQQAHEPGYVPEVIVTTRQLPAEGIEIRVRDKGISIPPAVRDKIFQPFFTTKPTGKGTGLGLSLSHNIIVQDHGGTLKVESREGEFTGFIIYLPGQ